MVNFWAVPLQPPRRQLYKKDKEAKLPFQEFLFGKVTASLLYYAPYSSTLISSFEQFFHSPVR